MSPFPNRAYGRPDAEVLPSSWADEHGRVAAGFCTAVVSIRRSGSSGSSFVEGPDGEGTTVATPFDPFATSVPATISPLGANGAVGPDTEVAGDFVRVTGYLVSLPRTFAGSDSEFLAESALVDVESCDDAALVGRTLRVNDVVRGSDHMTRDLVTTLND